MYYKTIIMDTNRPERSPIKDIEKKYYTNYNTFSSNYNTFSSNYNTFTGIIISIIFTINFAYLLKYYNFNQC